MEEYIKHCRNTDEEGVPVAWSEGRVRSLKELPRERDLKGVEVSQIEQAEKGIHLKGTASIQIHGDS